MAELAEMPTLNYRRHPAFAGLPVPSVPAVQERTVAEIADRIDAAYAGLLQGHGDFEREIAQPARALSACLRTELAEVDLAEWADRSIRAALGQLADEVMVAQRARPAGSRDPRLPDLQRDGFVPAGLPDAVRERLWLASEPHRQRLLARASAEPGRAQWAQVPAGGAFGRMLLEWLREAGMAELAAAYRGVPMAFDHLALHYSHAGQGWFRNCYADAGLPTSALANLHTDKDTTSIKMLIYLQPVASIDDGAFCYLRGSHRWRRAPFRFAISNQLDAQHDRLFHPPRPADGYYRPRFRDPPSRARMLAMPTLFQGCSHFGCDVIDADPLSRSLLAAEVPITGGHTAVLFDGGLGLHRGGMVRGAPRWAIQLGFRPVVPATPARRLRQGFGRLWRRWQEWRQP